MEKEPYKTPIVPISLLVTQYFWCDQAEKKEVGLH